MKRKRFKICSCGEGCGDSDDDADLNDRAAAEDEDRAAKKAARKAARNQAAKAKRAAEAANKADRPRLWMLREDAAAALAELEVMKNKAVRAAIVLPNRDSADSAEYTLWKQKTRLSQQRLMRVMRVAEIYEHEWLEYRRMRHWLTSKDGKQPLQADSLAACAVYVSVVVRCVHCAFVGLVGRC